jgi:Zn-dependent membrane protease YugP
MIGFDLTYFVFLAPALLLAAWASWRVRRAYAEARDLAPASGYSGAEAAATVLDRHGLSHVGIEVTDGFLSDHYDPAAKVLRLSPEVYAGRSRRRRTAGRFQPSPQRRACPRR